MVMHVTINMGLCAYRLLPWKWEMVWITVWTSMEKIIAFYCMLQIMQTFRLRHTSITLVYILDVMVVLKISKLSKHPHFIWIERNTKRFWQYLFSSVFMKAVITHRFSSCCCLFLSLCVLNSCLLLCCCKSPGKQNTCCDHRQLSSYITCIGEWHGTAHWNYTILPWVIL